MTSVGNRIPDLLIYLPHLFLLLQNLYHAHCVPEIQTETGNVFMYNEYLRKKKPVTTMKISTHTLYMQIYI